jgi:ribosomal protein L37AE/L43A
MSMRSGASLAARPPEEMREQCRLCNAPATIELFTGYWLCQPCCDRLAA